MLTLYDYLPSQNGWKVRQILAQLGRPFRTIEISIFEGAGQTPEVLRLNPLGKVPILVEENGASLAESNAIITYLADNTPYLPSDPMARARVHQWLSFEQEQVEAAIGSLRYWTLTGKLDRRPDYLVASKRATSLRALTILNRELSTRPFIAGDVYTIADISIYAYAAKAGDAGLDVTPFTHFAAWMTRVEGQPGHLPTSYPYSIDPYSRGELP